MDTTEQKPEVSSTPVTITTTISGIVVSPAEDKDVSVIKEAYSRPYILHYGPVPGTVPSTQNYAKYLRKRVHTNTDGTTIDVYGEEVAKIQPVSIHLPNEGRYDVMQAVGKELWEKLQPGLNPDDPDFPTIFAWPCAIIRIGKDGIDVDVRAAGAIVGQKLSQG